MGVCMKMPSNGVVSNERPLSSVAQLSPHFQLCFFLRWTTQEFIYKQYKRQANQHVMLSVAVIWI